ncbi:hypothetical protein SAMN05216365_14317 [Porphyromonadaceae bacterium NLAE-zl-C104]|jgi:hypothetical protein|nr:hypothetical protein SAMN05216331_1554 [Porphyromonadaceae bacterium KH3R12]SFT02166.1 hypothetical protein SAMN05216365_14317 [Porphyromonadaceae bacterium NLAE-zl-C104]
MRNKFTWNLLFNPFTKIAGWQAFALGMLFVLLTGVIGTYAGVAFDGAIDSHITEYLSLKDSFLFLVIAVVSVVVILFIAGLIISKRLRFVDILGTMVLARSPLILLTIFGLFVTSVPAEEIMANPMVIMHNPGLIIFSVISIPVMVWFIALMYNGFKVSTGAKGSKLVIGFIIGLIVAEVVSKVLIFQIF